MYVPSSHFFYSNEYYHIDLIKHKIILSHNVYPLLFSVKNYFGSSIFFTFIPRCLVVSKVEPTGVGGSLNVTFMCSGCEKRS